MNNHPLFSVLIASYNNGQYLEESLESVFNQTYTNWEIVIVDDCSTDTSKEIYKKYTSDSRIKFFYNNINGGCGFTKRKCIELSSGIICGFLDPDDKLMPEALSDMVKLHNEHTECSLIYSTLYEINSTSKEVIQSEKIGKIEDGEDFLINSIKGIAPFASFKRTFYNKTEGINPLLRTSEDSDLYYKLEEVGSIFFFDKPLYCFRTDNINSVSVNGEEKVKYSYLNMMIASLNGIIRRITSKSELFLSKKDVYHKQMRLFLDYFIVNKNDLMLKYTIRFCYHYMKFNKFSLRSIKHIIKMFLRKYKSV